MLDVNILNFEMVLKNFMIIAEFDNSSTTLNTEA